MTNSEFYTRAQTILEDYMNALPIDSKTSAYFGASAAHIAILLTECRDNHIPQKEFLFILRHHFSYKTSYKSTIKEAFRLFYRELKELTIVDQTLSDTVETLRHQGKNTYE